MTGVLEAEVISVHDFASNAEFIARMLDPNHRKLDSDSSANLEVQGLKISYYSVRSSNRWEGARRYVKVEYNGALVVNVCFGVYSWYNPSELSKVIGEPLSILKGLYKKALMERSWIDSGH